MALFDSHSYYSFFLSSSTTNGGVAILHLLLHFFLHLIHHDVFLSFIDDVFFHMYVDMQGSMCLHGQRHIAVILLNISFKDF